MFSLYNCNGIQSQRVLAHAWAIGEAVTSPQDVWITLLYTTKRLPPRLPSFTLLLLMTLFKLHLYDNYLKVDYYIILKMLFANYSATFIVINPLALLRWSCFLLRGYGYNRHLPKTEALIFLQSQQTVCMSIIFVKFIIYFKVLVVFASVFGFIDISNSTVLMQLEIWSLIQFEIWYFWCLFHFMMLTYFIGEKLLTKHSVRRKIIKLITLK